jgi:predicted protein tyrosine phosphatase
MKHTTHLSREQAQRLKEPADAVLISIRSTHGDNSPMFHPGVWADVLPVYFDDIRMELDRWEAQGYLPPKQHHATAIASFIRKHWNRSIVAHCDAGISRSAAVCAVLKSLGWKYIVPNSFGLHVANPVLQKYLENCFEKEVT